MKHANALSIPHINPALENRAAVVQLKVQKKSDLAPSDAGFLFLLTILLVAIGRVMGTWIFSDQVKIQKGPHEFVSRNEEYQNLHNQVGPNTFFRMY